MIGFVPSGLVVNKWALDERADERVPGRGRSGR